MTKIKEARAIQARKVDYIRKWGLRQRMESFP